MIVLTHNNQRVISAFELVSKVEVDITTRDIGSGLFELAKHYQNELIIWCHDDLKEFIYPKAFTEVFHHKLIMASYEVRNDYFIAPQIGYVDSSPFINAKKYVHYPTWLMSSCIGGVHAEVLLKFDSKELGKLSFDYMLTTIAKQGMLKGLFCYSAPQLLKPNTVQLKPFKPSIYTLFRFIKQHYRARWTFLTFINICMYEKRFEIFPFMASFFVSKSKFNLNLSDIIINEDKQDVTVDTIDVVIPTIGRKTFLYDVLQDLSKQTLLPKNIIIVEQNPEEHSVSELEYLSTKTWPFHIEHVFTHQTGACNARNIALEKVSSGYVFMADDDIRFENTILKSALREMNTYGLRAATLSCLKEGEKESFVKNMQWHTFGSGCSIVRADILKKLRYDQAFEHGFGEDGDFGMQIRNLGEDIGYLYNCRLLHLKAPTGGFRTPIEHPWEKETMQPKPSPTIMLFNLKHQSPFQLHGYKTLLFFKFFKLQNNKNVFSYLSQMRSRWQKSIYWAQQLQSKSQL